MQNANITEEHYDVAHEVLNGMAGAGFGALDAMLIIGATIDAFVRNVATSGACAPDRAIDNMLCMIAQLPGAEASPIAKAVLVAIAARYGGPAS